VGVECIQWCVGSRVDCFFACFGLWISQFSVINRTYDSLNFASLILCCDVVLVSVEIKLIYLQARDLE
jgi:hypothetical protein